MIIIDRYIIKKFISTWVFAIIALCVIFLIVNLLENLDEFLDQNATAAVMAEYYISYFPEILKILTPIATLLSTLFSIGKLSTLNEITAMKSGGMSLYRIMLPLVTLALIISFAQLYFNGWVVPKANQKKNELEQIYLNKGDRRGPIYNLHLRESPKKNILMQYYNSKKKAGSRVSIEEYSNEMNPRLTKRIEAEKIYWIDSLSKWKMKNVIIRNYNGKHVITSQRDSIIIELRLGHNEIERLKMSSDEMNFDELWKFINVIKKGGKDVRRQVIDYYGQWAFPFANFIVVLFGVPFASIRKKGGIAIQIGAAMIISFIYLLFVKFSQTIGYSTAINPIIIGWSANIIFFIAGLFVIFRTRT